MPPATPRPRQSPRIIVLAGGLSTRMGRDKSSLRLGRRTLTAHLRARLAPLGWPVHVLRRDTILRCGPLGGLYTALRHPRHAAVPALLFLACDMPFVTPAWLRHLRRALRPGDLGAFTVIERLAGFPLILRPDALPIIDQQIQQRQFSLQALARALRARAATPPSSQVEQFLNLNTPAEFAAAALRATLVNPSH